MFPAYEEIIQCEGETKEVSKITGTTPPPEQTTHPRVSPHMGESTKQPKQEYAYNPHLPPSLRFDENGDADQLPELLAKAQQQALSADEVQILAEALRHHNPWLEWAGKQEAESFSVDPVALHIHERVSAKAIVKVAERENVQRELFADPATGIPGSGTILPARCGLDEPSHLGW